MDLWHDFMGHGCYQVLIANGALSHHGVRIRATSYADALRKFSKRNAADINIRVHESSRVCIKELTPPRRGPSGGGR